MRHVPIFRNTIMNESKIMTIRSEAHRQELLAKNAKALKWCCVALGLVLINFGVATAFFIGELVKLGNM